MARIRSIKPEFPQSESMGRVSRDARLLFVMLWPVCDDHGRTRAASRMLASLLFPYDNDAGDLIDGWLDELEREKCIRRYEANGSTFLEVCNWLIHQKIDRPSHPQFPDPPALIAKVRERSRKPREDSSLERKGKEGKGREEDICASPAGDAPSIPFAKIVAAFNSTLTRLPKVQDITAKRKSAIRKVWQESPNRQSVEFFASLFEEYEDAGFTNGTGPYRPPHENWRPDFDYLIKPEVVTKTYEKAMHRMEAQS